MNWVTYSIFSAVGFGGISLLLTHFTRQNISTLIINLWFWGLTAIGFLGWHLVDRAHSVKISSQQFGLFILLAAIAVATNYFSVKALETGPNTGIVRSVQMAQIAVAAIGGIYLFNQGIDLKGFIGIALIIIGIYLLINK